jgi:hypothetical protein
MAAIYHAGGNSNTANGIGRLPNGAAAGGGGGAAAAGGGAEGWLRPAWQAEQRRIEGLELLDELEEWRLLQVGRAFKRFCLGFDGLFLVRNPPCRIATGLPRLARHPCVAYQSGMGGCQHQWGTERCKIACKSCRGCQLAPWWSSTLSHYLSVLYHTEVYCMIWFACTLVCMYLQEHYCLALGVLGDGPSGGWLADALRLQQLAALTK